MTPPVPSPPKRPRLTTIHGRTLADDYFWMRSRRAGAGDPLEPEILSHLEAENAYTDAVMAPFKGLQERLYGEILGRMKQTDLSVPARKGDCWYYSRTEEGKQYPWMCRRRGSMHGEEEILLDLNALAEGHPFLSVGAYAVSDDANWLAYSVDTTGYRLYTLHVKDLRTGALSTEAIERTGSVVWAADNRTLFYTTEDRVTKRSDRFWRHLIGESGSDLVYEEPSELFDVGASRSLDGRMIFLTSYAKTSREVRLLPADTPHAPLRVVALREDGHEYEADHYEGRLFIATNKGAKNFRVVTAPIDDPSPAGWTEFIPHNPLLKIENLSFFRHHLVVSEREAGLTHLRVIDMRNRTSHRIAADEPDYVISMGVNPEFDTMSIRYAYQSMVTPPTVYEYDLETRERKLLKQQEVLGGYAPAGYRAERIWVPARDGTQVPLSLVHRGDVPRDGSAPMLLYAYGSYGISMAPTFSSARLSLLDRGVIYAVAYVRGGGELGEDWREQGRMMQKLNTFHDFIDCAEYLVTHRYTAPDRLAIQGGSAGGLLVGAVANMRPDLFTAVVAQVPFLDVINTMLDATLPLTTAEYLEWGNPNELDAFEYIARYSPYDNIRPQAYPSMLLHASLNDSQVPYWEAAKFAARVRDVKLGDRPVLLKTNLGAGHGGASGRYDAIRETAFTYAFLLWQLGLGDKAEQSPPPSPH